MENAKIAMLLRLAADRLDPPARQGLGTALEFNRLGDPPLTAEQVRRNAQEELQRDRDWADFARGIMDG